MIYNLISPDNWNTAYFENNNLKALIGFELDPNEPNLELYTVSLIDQEYTEIYQKTFKEINAACKYINLKYQNLWEFKSLIQVKSSSGCSTCVAH